MSNPPSPLGTQFNDGSREERWDGFVDEKSETIELTWKCMDVVSVRSTRHPVTVTTRIITFLAGNPYKPSFATVTGWGVVPKYQYEDKQKIVYNIDPEKRWIFELRGVEGSEYLKNTSGLLWSKLSFRL